MRKLKAGIVGCGGIANGKHLPAMKKSGLYEIVAFCDIIRDVYKRQSLQYPADRFLPAGDPVCESERGDHTGAI